MGLFLRTRGRLLRPHVLRFDDGVEHIVFGTDPAHCQVLFAPRMKAVAPQHCALDRVLGTYRWVLDERYPVYVDGVRVLEGDTLPKYGTLRLGARGPRMFFSHGENAEVPVVQPLGRVRAGLGRMRTLTERVRLHRLALVVLALVLLVVSAAGAMAVHRGAPAISDEDARLRTVLRDAAPSVYRVIKRSSDGVESGSGTAFVVGPSLLATNAHVAEQFHEMHLRGELLVRGTGPTGRTYAVRSVRLHPGYDAFALAWASYGPQNGDKATGRRGGIRSPGSACDVALLEVDEGAVLGGPLPLADDATLGSLRPGQPLGYVGYNSEGLALDGSPVRQPVPHLQTGIITALTTFLGQEDAQQGNRLLQHSCPGTGGSSGSPLFDSRGRVIGIEHAGNFSFGFGGRIPLGVGVRFGQRIDMLRELLEDRAHEALVAHLERWNSGLRVLYTSGAELRRAEERERVLGDREWRTAASRLGGPRRFTPVGFHVFDVGRALGNYTPTVHRVAVRRAGCYAVLVWCYGERREHPIDVTYGGAPLGTKPDRVRRRGSSIWHVRAFDVLAGGEGTIAIAVTPRGEPVRCRVEILRAQPSPPPPPKPAPTPVPTPSAEPLLVPRDDDSLARCLEHLSSYLGGAATSELVYEHDAREGDEDFKNLEDWYSLVEVGRSGFYLVEVRVLRGAELLRLRGADDDELPVSRGHPQMQWRAAYAGPRGRVFVHADLVSPPDVSTHPELLIRIHCVTWKK